MLELVQSFSNVDAYLVREGIFLICRDGDIWDVKADLGYSVRLDSECKASEIDKNSYLVVLYSDGGGYVKDGTGFRKIPYSVYTARDHKGMIPVYEYDYEATGQKLNVYDIKSGLLLQDWRQEGSIALVDDLVIYRSKEKVVIVKPHNDEVVLDLSGLGRYRDQWGENQPARLVRIVGIHNAILWLAITNNTLLGIEKSTGQIKRIVREIEGFKSDWLPSAIPDSASMQYDVLRGLLVGFRWEFYWEVDCTTGQVTLTDLTEEFKKAQIRCDAPDFVLDGQLIYFLQKRPGKVGVFNIATKKLEWQYSLKDNVFPIKISWDNGYLYLKDSTNSLYVFRSTSKTLNEN